MILKLQKISDMEQQGPLLIYYNARGTCQIIRSVLLEIGIKYDEVFVDCQGHIPYELTDLGYKFTVKELPYLIHNGLVINEVFPIIKYLCVKYNRVDLLGTSVPDSIRIAEIVVRYMREKCKMFTGLFGTIEEYLKNNTVDQEGLKEIKKHAFKIFKQQKHLQACFKMYIKSASYLCGYPTILDFIFYDCCFYFVNIFSDLCQDMAVFTLYKNFFQQTSFYQKNKEKLESYKVFLPGFDKKTNEVFKLLWRGDSKYFGTEAKKA